MFKKTYSLLTIVFWILSVPSWALTGISLFALDERPPEIVFYIIAAPWICLFAGLIFCGVTRRDNLLLMSKKEEMSLAMEIIENTGLELGHRLWLVKQATRDVLEMDENLLCRQLAANEKLSEMMHRGFSLMSKEEQ